MTEVNQIELDLDTEEATTVDVEVTDEKSVPEDDSFDRAESATQKRIDRLTKKMREAERRESEALNFAKSMLVLWRWAIAKQRLKQTAS
mgnify:CR=1 FL=1